VGLIGAGIQRSLTPAMQEAEARAQGLRLHYQLIDLDRRGQGARRAAGLLDAARTMGFAGLNITYPCKQAVIPLLDALSDEARAMGAVNTVVLPGRPADRPQHRRLGLALGLRAPLPGADLRAWCCWVPAAPARPSPMRCCAWGRRSWRWSTPTPRAPGAGGQPERALPRPRAVAPTDGRGRPAGRHRPDPRHAHRHGQAARPAAAGRAAAPGLWVAEIVYFPLETALLQAARARGCPVSDGGGMAVGQAVGAFELFTGCEAGRPARMDAHFRRWWPHGAEQRTAADGPRRPRSADEPAPRPRSRARSRCPTRWGWRASSSSNTPPPRPQALGQVLEQMGFRPVARHRSREVLLYRQGGMNVIVNAHRATGLPPGTDEAAADRRRGAARARRRRRLARVVDLGAWPVPVQVQPMELHIPGIHGVGAAACTSSTAGSEFSIYDVDFVPIPTVDPQVPASPKAALVRHRAVRGLRPHRRLDRVLWRAVRLHALPDEQRFGILPAGRILASPCGSFYLQLIEPAARQRYCQRRAAAARGLRHRRRAGRGARAAPARRGRSSTRPRCTPMRAVRSPRDVRRRDVRTRAPRGAVMPWRSDRHIADFGMDTITLAGPLEAKLRAIREAGFGQVMLAARDLVGHPRAGAPRCGGQGQRPACHRLPGAARLRGPVGPPARLQGRHRRQMMLEMCAALGSPVLLACSSTSPHASADRDAIARDLRKLAMMALPLGIKVAFEGLSWGRHINDSIGAWDVVQRADCPTWASASTATTASPPTRRWTRWTRSTRRKIFLVQLSDFMWQETRTARGARDGAHLPRLPGRRRAQRRAGRLVRALDRHGLPRRLQLRGLQRRLPAAAAGRGRARAAEFGPVAGRGRAAPGGAAAVAEAPNVLVVHTALKGLSLTQLLQDPRSRNTGLAFASAGYGHSSHLAAEVLMSRTGARWLHVPYRGTGPASRALIGGEVQLMLVPVGSVKTMLATGQVHALAVAHPQRLEALPSTPTLAELGITGAEFSQWYGVFAPAGTPPAALRRLQAATLEGASAGELRRQLQALGLETAPLAAAEFGAFLAAQAQRLSTLVRREGVEGAGR
jgi:shikimate dehydrogenase